ncbi:uncharacterized protein N7477_004211, partial [Penicillium maclennaniae]|uniref:uncharacterized protein n=1 Tax=Penicillium maclennaniae TaxID=1343394 RepID=UPI00253F7A19
SDPYTVNLTQEFWAIINFSLKDSETGLKHGSYSYIAPAVSIDLGIIYSYISANIKYWPFKVINKPTKPILEVEFKGKTKQFTPEKISSIILTKIRKTAKTYLSGTINNAIITIFTYFNNS